MKKPFGADLDFIPVDPQYFKVMRIYALLIALVTVVPALIFAISFGREGISSIVWWSIVGVLAVVSLTVLLFARRRAKAIGYLQREDELIIRCGIMFHKMTVIPYGRMQQVNVETGPILSRFGLAKITLVTASAESSGSIPGISRSEAERLREDLTALGNARMEGL
ncbi:membrane protein YdbS with pleckstrin-like domain [Arcanobacterium pluranimalium]|uniref:PH domain-containing protein n=1 Tax=Arcanobacterium pluranimalium TaxID=108028 RepID=UPI00195AB8B2|nr:PH domain-containing protein [Arcanobacterium pluranimalium]MBM7825933.1 membrane protein YdbS with pleckstrin-like domain [Arcanobacterium pluranimalium]